MGLLWNLTILSRLFFFLLLQLSSKLPLFDASPLLVSNSPFLRWDAFHFLHIARNGYCYEHQWAFFPGSPLLIRIFASFINLLSHGCPSSNLLLGGIAAALACDSTHTLYTLSLHHLRLPRLALIAAMLSLLPASPATLYFAPYSEPFFTFLSYRGMLCCSQRRWLLASLFFASAGLFRSNAIFLSGFLMWGLLISPFLARQQPSLKAMVKCAVLVAIVLAPFVYHQFSAYMAFCTNQLDVPDWCHRFPPSIYTHVQSKYWNVGLFRYWSLNQLPNFLLAAPLLTLLLVFITHYLHSISPHLTSPSQNPSPFLSSHMAPHVLHAAVLCFILLFASHTQIILRLAASMPLTYWAAAWLVVEHPKWASWWIAWSLLWAMISVLLWGAFLPPA